MSGRVWGVLHRAVDFVADSRDAGGQAGRCALRRRCLGHFSPQILAVDHRHRHGVEVEIIKQVRIDADLGVVEVRLAARPVRRFRIGAAAAIGAEMMFDGAAAPQIGRDIFRRRRQAKLRRGIIGPQRAPLGT